MSYITEGDKRIAALREKGNKYAFMEWEYDACTGKPAQISQKKNRFPEFKTALAQLNGHDLRIKVLNKREISQ